MSALEVIWHDLECGLYRADLRLWRELARSCPNGPVLDIGAGAGRVTLELARTGRAVIALDRDPLLLGALRERAATRAGARDAGAEPGASVELKVTTVRADARTFALPEHTDLELCIVPMQTVQLLGGREARIAFLRRARAHLRRGGLLACSIVTELESFDCTGGGPAPTPDTVRIGATIYTSQATRVQVRSRTFTIERERRLNRAGTAQRDLIELDRVSAAELEREGAIVGLRAEPARLIAPTAEHAGSTVVMLRA